MPSSLTTTLITPSGEVAVTMIDVAPACLAMFVIASATEKYAAAAASARLDVQRDESSTGVADRRRATRGRPPARTREHGRVDAAGQLPQLVDRVR